jgi:peroxiredoxin
MSLREIFAELHQQFEGKDIMDRYAAVARVVADEQKKRFRKVGDSVPAFKLTDPYLGDVSSTELLQHGALVVSFYRGLWCPHCQKDLLGLEGVMQEIRQANASAVAVTYGLSVEVRRRLHEVHAFSFPLLNDIDGAVAEQFGIRWSAGDYQLIEAELGMDIVTLRNGGPWIFPMQASYVVAPGGIIILANVVFDYEQRSEPADVLSVLSPSASRHQVQINP